MNKKILFFSFTLIILFLLINNEFNLIPSLRFYYVENLQNFGTKTQSQINAPLGYQIITDSIKNPENKSIFQEITKITPYTPIEFNKRKNQNIYGNGEMTTDFKYFNNASNLLLFQNFNS